MYGMKEYDLRRRLHDEIHARPPIPITSPAQISYIALISDQANAQAEQRALAELAAPYGVAGPDTSTNHYSAQLGELQVKWERHAEFARYKFIRQGGQKSPFDTSALDSVPEDWLAKLPGEVIAATEVAVIKGPVPDDFESLTGLYFSGNTVVASFASGGQACAVTDFMIREDGRSRLLVFDLGMRERQAGRLVQRLLEIDTYRMMALLALPGAQKLRPFLDESERELARLTSSMTEENAIEDPALLQRLTSLEGAMQDRLADNHYRLSAANAYYEIVQRRIAELREERLGGIQTFSEFMERRLVPAMSTCRSVTVNAEQLSQRIARCTALLSTRVGIAQEAQNKQLLQSMARRAKLQLRLQQTVEGLSIAAISYYIVGLVGYMAKSLSAAGLPIKAEIITGLAVPAVLIGVYVGIARIRQFLKLD